MNENMKKFLLCALIAIIGCCFIFACENTEGSSSENPPIPNPSKQKTISKIIANYGYFEGYCGYYDYTFTYNEHNRVEQIYVVYGDGGKYNRCISIDYDGTTINISNSQSDSRYSDAVANNLGYITYWENTLFTYNHEGQIINDYYESTSSSEFGGSRSTIYEWRNDNIESVQCNFGDDRQYNYKVKYNNKYTNAVNLDLNWFVDPMNEFGSANVDFELATIGLMGKRCKNYITELCNASKDFKIIGVRASYDWTYDSDGYPIKCEVTEYASGAEYISTYLFIYSE